MIERLIIKNYLIIKDAELMFSKGLNILTGETGAGKSIILDSLSLILGERADYSIIKNDNDKLVVEGHFIFKNKKIDDFIKNKSLENFQSNGNTVVIIRRELNKKGVSRNFINDTPVSAGDLKAFGDMIVDIHSQNEHQSLLKKETHLEVLDNYISDDSVFRAFSDEYRVYKNLVDKYKDTLKKKDELLEKRSYLEFQLREINNVNPAENEDEEIENKLRRLENIEEISGSINNTISLLKDEDGNALGKISQSIKELSRVGRYDPSINKEIEELQNAFVSIKEIVNSIDKYSSSIEFDPEKTEELRERLGQLAFLKKRFNLSVNQLIEKAKELEKELNLVDNYDYEIENQEKECQKQKEKLYLAAERLSEQRKSVSKVLSQEVNKYLKEVGFEHAKFAVDINYFENIRDDYFKFEKNGKSFYISEKGIDDVEFLIITNKGDTFHPLRKIASGGEISRIMLAIKASLSFKDDVPILVFDEIDTGISGRVAVKVGKVLKELSKSHQVISITHLPQIAALSDNHFSVSKKVKNSDTIAEIKQLTSEEKVIEVAKLLSGDKITESSLNNAKELIEK